MDIDDSKPTDEKQDYSKLTVPELRQLCKDRGLDSKGGKATLVERLESPDTEDKEKSDGEEDDEEMEQDYTKYTVPELRQLCKDKGLDSKGRKAELVERLDGKAPPAVLGKRTTRESGETSPAKRQKVDDKKESELQEEEVKETNKTSASTCSTEYSAEQIA